MRVATYLVRHDIPEKHDVPRVNAHTMTGHGILDFVDNCSPRSFYAQNLRGFDDMVGSRMFTDYTCIQLALKNASWHRALTQRGHDLLQPVAFDQKLFVAFLPARIILLLDIDDRTTYSRNAFDHNIGQNTLEFSQPVVFVLAVYIDPQPVFPRNNSDCLSKESSAAVQVGEYRARTSCLIFSFLAATIAHLMSSRVNSSYANS